MDIFTIITTILNSAISIYAAFKKDNPTYSQKIALIKDPTIIISPSIPTNNSTYNDDEYDNYKFKTHILHSSILVLVGILFISWFIHSWTTSNVPEESVPILTILAKTKEAFFFSLLNTTRWTVLSICILSLGLIYKNFNNIYSPFRIFHIISYSILTVTVIINFIFLINTNYEYFLPNTALSVLTENLFISLLISEAPVILILQIGIIIICIYKLSHACIFGEYKSSRLRVNFRHILERIIAPIIFILSTLYIIILNKYT